jgi:hypothetical protein
MRGDNLERRLRALPRALRPKRDLWPGIERSILGSAQPREMFQRPARRPTRLPARRAAWILAAAAGVAVTAGALFLAFRQPTDRESLLLSRVQEAERQYEKAKQELLQSLRDLASEYGEGTAGGMEEDFAALDREIADIKAAAIKDRGDPEVAYTLAGLYLRQTGALERAVSLVHSMAR